MYCGHCGAKCDDDARFCGVCGSPLGGNIPAGGSNRIGGNIPTGANSGASGNVPVVRNPQIAGNQNIPPRPVTPMVPVNRKRKSKIPIIAALGGALVVVVLVIVLLAGRLGGSSSSTQVVNKFMKAMFKDYNMNEAIKCFPKELQDEYSDELSDEQAALDSLKENGQAQFGSSFKLDYSIESDEECDVDEIYNLNNVVEGLALPDELHQVTVQLEFHYNLDGQNDEFESSDFDVYTGRYGNKWYIVAFD